MDFLRCFCSLVLFGVDDKAADPGKNLFEVGRVKLELDRGWSKTVKVI